MLQTLEIIKRITAVGLCVRFSEPQTISDICGVAIFDKKELLNYSHGDTHYKALSSAYRWFKLHYKPEQLKLALQLTKEDPK